MNFAKFLRTSSFKENLGTTASGFFYYFTVLPLGELIGTSLSISGHVLSQHSNVINIMNINDLVAAAWKNTFLGDITRNLAAVFYRLISVFICTY